jgi:hypothetical protein
MKISIANTITSPGTSDSASGPTYYYISNSGSGDGHSSGNAMSPAAAMAATIPTTGKVLLKAGETFNDFKLTLTNNGITVGSYGSGAQPILRGSVDIGGQTWTSEGSNVWSTPYSGSVKWLYVNGVSAQLAESQWFPITQQISATVLRAASLVSAFGATVVNAQVVVKEYYFTYSKVANVTAYNNGIGEITMDKPLHLAAGLEGFAFKLFNMRQFMNAAGEWFYDSAAQKIYYQTAGPTPAGSDIRVCGNDYGITLADGVSSTTISNIAITQYGQNAVIGKANNSTTISNCSINNVRGNGIWLYGTNSGSSITGNTFQNIDLNAMHFGGITGFTISNNTITSIGRGATLPFCQDIGTSYSNWEQELGSAITFTWDNFTSNKVPLSGNIQYNTMSNLSYIGILALGDVNISYNHVYNFCQDFTDGGGIYSINHTESPYGGISNNLVIDNNIIHGAVLSTANTPAAAGYAYLTCGIYLDICCNGAKIRNNTIYDVAGSGINVNYGNQNTIVSGNNVLGGITCIRYANNPVASAPVNSRTNIGNVCTNNTFVIRRTGQVCVTMDDFQSNASFNPFADNGANLGVSDNNKYINAYNTFIGSVLANSTFPTFAQYKTNYGKDASSTSISNYLTYSTGTDGDAENTILTNYTAASVIQNVGAGYSGYKDTSGNVITNQDVTIPAYGSYIYLSIAGDKNVRYVNSTAGVTSSLINAVLLPTYPAGLVTGDLLIAHVTSASGALVVTPPVGWSTLVDNHTSSNGYLFYKISDSTETGTAAFTWVGGSGVNKIARMYQFRYSLTSSFSEDPKNIITAGTTTTAPTLTSTGRRSLAVSFVNVYNNTAISSFTGATNGTWAEAVAEYVLTNVGIQLQTAILPTPTTISGGTMTTGSNGSVTLNMVFKNAV